MNRTIVRFISKVMALVIVPTALMIAVYYFLDPLSVLRYHIYRPDLYNLNYGVAAYRQFMHGKDSVGYDSFIMGNSVSRYFPIDEWAKYLPDSAAMMHYDSSCQNVSLLCMNVDFLSSQTDMRNVLIVLPFTALCWDEPKGALFNLPAEMYDSWLEKFDKHRQWFLHSWHYPVLKGHISRIMLDSETVGMDRFSQRVLGVEYHQDVNEEVFALKNLQLKEELERTRNRCPWLEEGVRMLPVVENQEHISDDVIVKLRHIADVFETHNTDYRVVLTPVFPDEIMNSRDDAVMRDIFGDRYYNLTGEYRWIFLEPGRMYDGIHIARDYCAQILKRVYAPEDSIFEMKP